MVISTIAGGVWRGVENAQDTFSGAFFEPVIRVGVTGLARAGKTVFITSLVANMLDRGRMPQLLAVANYVTKIHAICLRCGYPATHSFRKLKDKNQVLLGEKETYEARCRDCFTAGMSEQ
mgnify:CR=1 FL=1